MEEQTKKVTFKVRLPRGLKSTFTRREIRSAVKAVQRGEQPRTTTAEKVVFAHS